MDALWIMCTLLAGLNAGLLVSGILEGLYMRGVGLSAYLQMHQPRDRVLRRVMPPVLLSLLAGCLLLALRLRGQISGMWVGAAFVLILMDVLITVRVMVPLNAQLQTYDAQHPPEETQAVRRRWYALHSLRTALGGLAFALLLMAREL